MTVASFAAGLLVYRALADRAAARGAGAGLPRRGAFQRAELFARLRPHAGAARTRLCAPDRGQRRDRQGSEDLRPQRLPDRPLHHASRPTSTPPTAGSRCGAPTWGGLFTTIGTVGYYLAYAYIVWRTLAGEFSIGDLTFLAGSFRRLRSLLEGLLSGFSSTAGQALYLDDLFSFFEVRAGDPVAGQSAAVSRSRSARASSSRMSASAIPAPSAGRCAISTSR